MTLINRIFFSLALFLPLFDAVTASAFAQCDGDSITETDYLVRDVKVETLFRRAPGELLQILAKHRGEPYRPFDTSVDTISIGHDEAMSSVVFMREVKEYLAKASDDSRFGLSRYGEVSVKGYTACVTKVSPVECQKAFGDDPRSPVTKCVDVVVKVKTARVYTGGLGANLLALARSNKLIFHSQLPRPLLALNPNFWVDRDREYGTAAVGGIKTNLLDLPAILRGQTPRAQKAQLLMKMDGSRSLDNNFYNATTSLALLNIQPSRSVETLGFEGRFALNRQPQGAGLLFSNAGHFSANATLNIKGGPITRLNFGAGYRWANNRYFDRSGTTIERASEHAFESRMIADGHLAGGYLRGGVWFDSASPNNKLGSYRRLAAMAGYSKEIVLPQKKCRLNDGQCSFSEKNAPAVGVEILAGGGRAWGKVPEYARYYGGNSAGNFLYDGIDSPNLANMPGGPLIRSFGKNQAGARARTQTTTARGGEAYWNLNMTVSLPIPALSRPLIPALPISGANVSSCDQCKSLKDFVKNNVSEGRNLYVDAMAFRSLSKQQQEDLGLDPDDAPNAEEKKRLKERLLKAEASFAGAQDRIRPEADRIWREITPMVGHISDNANLYSVKPLVMFDAARVSDRGVTGQKTRFALGGGLQFNVAVAKFEVGYLKALNRLPGDKRGNFVVRMVFEKFF